jgi:hypothetical protein
MKRTATIVIACLIATPALAEEVLYCTDTDANGFMWDAEGNGERTGFQPQRFTVKVISETERKFQYQHWPTPGPYRCTKVQGIPGGLLSCVGILGDALWPINFRGNSYVRAAIIGAPTLPSDATYVAYGTCAKF